MVYDRRAAGWQPSAKGAGSARKERPVDGAIEVFVNGLAGVFAGMAMLYLAIKVISALAGRLPAKKED